HRDPHSFPTRRSSDLELLSHVGAVQVERHFLVKAGLLENAPALLHPLGDAGFEALEMALVEVLAVLADPLLVALDLHQLAQQHRSEEHTSELQSRENL